MSDFMELTEVIDFAVSLLGSKPAYIKDNYKEVVREPRAVDQTAIGEQYNFSVRQLMAFRARGKAFRIHKKVKTEEVEA